MHYDGQIWSQALWEIRLGYVALGKTTAAWDTTLIDVAVRLRARTPRSRPPPKTTYELRAGPRRRARRPTWSRTGSRPAASRSDRAAHGFRAMGEFVRLEVGRRRRHDPAGPAEDERPQRAGAGGDPRRPRPRRPTRDDVTRGRRLRRRAGLRGRRRRQGDGGHVLHRHGQALRRRCSRRSPPSRGSPSRSSPRSPATPSAAAASSRCAPTSGSPPRTPSSASPRSCSASSPAPAAPSG